MTHLQFNKQLVSLKSEAQTAQAVAVNDKDNDSNLNEKQLDAALESVRSELTTLHEGLRAKVSVGRWIGFVVVDWEVLDARAIA